MEFQRSPIKVLLVEDEAADAAMIKDLIERKEQRINLITFSNPSDASAHLEGQLSNTAPDLPYVILLSLNPGGASSVDFLEKIKQHDQLLRIPVLMLFNPSLSDHIDDCYGKHANCLIPKPEKQEDFERVLQNIIDFWLNICQLPIQRI